RVELNPPDQTATVIVPDRQLSRAIGKEGQNARLAAKLTGWRIDIKSASMAEAERIEASKTAAPAAAPEGELEAEAEEVGAAAEPAPEALPEEIMAELEPLELAEEPTVEEAAEEGEPVAEEVLIPPPIMLELAKAGGKPQLRFAEDIMAPRRAKAPAKAGKPKKKKKGVYAKDTSEEGVKARKGRRDFTVEEDEEDF
ncbi:MAG: transcription termination/antitermination protein NusA, partial [Chloroflexota bacterium]